MRPILIAIILTATAFPANSAPRGLPKAGLPMPVPPAFVTEVHGLTFRTPPHATYCPLPEDWVGSDHGTQLFLKSPNHCYGAGFPSSARGVSPSDLPSIDVYYEYYDAADDDQGKPTCRVAGRAMLFAQRVKLCRGKYRGMATLTVTSEYKAETSSRVIVTLTAKPSELAAHVQAFTNLLISMRPCTAQWTSSNDSKVTLVGAGAPCPKDAKFF